MNSRPLAFAALFAGAALASLSACAEAENASPVEAAGSTAAGAGMVRAGAGGAAAMAGATSGAGAPAGGAPVTSAGAPPTSGAGAPPSGTAGSPATSGCKLAVGTVAELAIDDLEDGENAIQALGQRLGYWYTYNDGSAMQVPAPGTTVPFKTAAGGHSPLFSAKTTGPAFTLWGAGMGFDFNNVAMKSCPYDASAYQGIKFWAKGNIALKAMITIPTTTQQAGTNSGTCTTAAKCEDHYALTPKPLLTDTWTQFTIDFASAATFAQEGWGVKVPFEKNRILAVQFQVPANAAFDFSVDDLTFY